jgi:hypothetical protein
VSVDFRSSWVEKAEDAIRGLRDVESATIQSEGDAIREIHVLTRSNRPPKQIVRDVQTVLQARFNRSIDYRVVSVAYLTQTASADASPAPKTTAPPPPAAAPPPPPAAAPPPAASARSEAPPAERPAPPAPDPGLTAPAVVRPDARPAERERIRFGSVNLFVSGPRTQAQVELRWRGLPRMGSASGWSTRANAHRLIAQATVAAVREFLADEIALSARDAEFLKLGRERCAVVSLSLLAGRQEKTLVGTCAVEQDLQQAVVCATLDALNRVVAGLRPLEPTEYIVRPTSDSRRERSE